jgi:hypothetical protein
VPLAGTGDKIFMGSAATRAIACTFRSQREVDDETMADDDLSYMRDDDSAWMSSL